MTRTAWRGFALLLIVLMACPVFAASTTGTHTGRVVRFGPNTPIAGALVQLGAVWTGTTAADGTFATGPVPAGTYSRAVIASGFQTDVRDVTIIAGQNVHIGAQLLSATSTPGPTVTATRTPTASPAPTATATATVTPTSSPTQTATPVPTATAPPVGGCLPWISTAAWPTGVVPTASQDGFIPQGRSVCMTAGTIAARSLIIEGELTVNGGAETIVLETTHFECRGSGRIRIPTAYSGTVTVRLLVASEANYSGGTGMAIVPGDVGFWTHEGCQLDLQGASKTPWTRIVGSAAAGAAVIDVEAAQGWRVGDELAVGPHEPVTVPNWYDRYDYPRIAVIAGTRVTLDRPLQFPHPQVTIRPLAYPDAVLGAVVMNLTRTINIEGRPGECATNPNADCRGLRAHVWIHNDRPVAHRLAFVAFRWLGPLRLTSGGDFQEGFGRYPLHFHVNGDFSAGTDLNGLVIRDSGNRGPVFHDSNGIALRNSVMHNIVGSVVWWDSRAIGCTTCAEPRGLQFLTNVVSRARWVPSFRGATLTGWFIGRQDGNVYRGNVTMGIQGVATASGINWPELTHGVAVFDAGNIVQSTRTTCVYTWQNDARLHAVSNFIAYFCPRGIVHGAYANAYVFTDVTILGQLGVELHAVSLSPLPPLNSPAQRWVRLSVDAGGTPCAVRTARHVLAPGAPVFFDASRFTNYTRAAFCMDSDGNDDWIEVDAVTTASGALVSFGPTVTAGTRLVDRRSMQTYWRRDQSARCPTTGRLDAVANAWVCPH